MRIITLEGEFTTLNEYILAERGHYRKAAEIKKSETLRVRYETIGILPISPKYYPMVVSFFWFRRNTKTDPDNVAFSKKFILDGLQKSGVIRNDAFNDIRCLVYHFRIDVLRPRVEIRFKRYNVH